jgi:hypothetical protein
MSDNFAEQIRSAAQKAEEEARLEKERQEAEKKAAENAPPPIVKEIKQKLLAAAEKGEVKVLGNGSKEVKVLVQLQRHRWSSTRAYNDSALTLCWTTKGQGIFRAATDRKYSLSYSEPTKVQVDFERVKRFLEEDGIYCQIVRKISHGRAVSNKMDLLDGPNKTIRLDWNDTEADVYIYIEAKMVL